MLGYCMALAQQASGVEIHVVSMNVNHHHTEVTDPDANVPLFSYYFHKYAALCLAAMYGERECIWMANQKTNYLQLGDDDTVFSKAVYAITNVVKDGIVSRSDYWDGLLLWRPGSYTFHRPDVYFDPEGDLPERLALRISPLPVAGHESTRALMQSLGASVKAAESEAREFMKKQSRSFLGANWVRNLRVEDSPASTFSRRSLIPRFGCVSPERRAKLVQALKAFATAYRAARRQWIAGERNVQFPAGTYKLRVEFNVSCEEDTGWSELGLDTT